MRNIAAKEKYKKGDVIIKEGGFSDGTYVIISGKVEVAKIVGDKKIVVAVLVKDDIFGEMSFLQHEPRSASVTAIEDCEIGLLDKDFLDNELNKASQDFRLILTQLTARLRKTTSELAELKLKGCG
ncbi:MAG: cyclic nucleotide-binding domain-containing protein [Nitrospirae bacterium]|nr:MAG: cyclic nucleotide-binding domain-containing protein [Nitrospirota bacterium]